MMIYGVFLQLRPGQVEIYIRITWLRRQEAVPLDIQHGPKIAQWLWNMNLPHMSKQLPNRLTT